MPPQLSEDEVDDLLYYSRTGDLQEFNSISDELGKREHTTLSEILLATKDSYSGNGPLHMAAANGHTEVLTHLISALATPAPQNPTQLSLLNAQNLAGNTPLHWAALNGHLDCVKVLIDNGADPTVTNSAGHDAVYEAEVNDRKEVVEWVLREGGEALEEGIGGTGEGGANREGDEDMEEEAVEEEEAVLEGEHGAQGGEEEIREGMDSLVLKDKMEKS